MTSLILKVIPPSLFFFKFVSAIPVPWPLHINYRIRWSMSRKHPTGVLIGCKDSIDHPRGKQYYYSAESSNPQATYVFPFIQVFLDFFQQHFAHFSIQMNLYLSSSIQEREQAIVDTIVFRISVTSCLLLVYRNMIDFCVTLYSVTFINSVRK